MMLRSITQGHYLWDPGHPSKAWDLVYVFSSTIFPIGTDRILLCMYIIIGLWTLTNNCYCYVTYSFTVQPKCDAIPTTTARRYLHIFARVASNIMQHGFSSYVMIM
jgi:hypothetical protein